ncbi:MAG: extracellular solute-binding protein [Actinomycetota bacterium]|nr:extracellular solute-binding protein [Actinomycetota bacterium]
MRLRRASIAVAAAAFALTGVAACGSTDGGATGGTTPVPAAGAGANEQQPPAYQELVAAANKEGALNLNWGFSAPDSGALLGAFQKAYPGIKVTLTPVQDQPSNTAKLLEEFKAQKPASSDAYLGVPQLLVAAGPGQADAMLKVDWATLAPWTKGSETSDGIALAMLDQVAGFTYNTTQVNDSEVPKTSSDILAMKQPVASTPYAAQFNVLGAPEAMGPQGLQDYLKKFKPAGFIGCGDLSRVASGEFAALWMSCGTNIGDIFAAQGAPLKTAVIKDAAVTYPWYGAVPKNSAHPNAAKVWITWLETQQAQQLLFKQEFADNKRHDGSQTAKQIADFGAQGVKLTVADYDFVKAHPDIYTRAYAGQLIALLTKK